MSSSLFQQSFAPYDMDGPPVPARNPSPEFSSAFTPYQMPSTNNILSHILGPQTGAEDMPSPENVSPAPPTRAPRERRSLLDIIGGIADTVASVGGADPLYRMNLNAESERQRQVDLDEMRRQQFEQQQRLGNQQLQVGDLGIANDERSRIGDALASVIGAEDPAAVWGSVAQQAGIPPDKAAAIAGALQQGVDPARLAQSFGYAPRAQGSLPKEVQIYQMLQTENPELAPAYLQSLTNPGNMTDYQKGQLEIALANLSLNRDKFAEGQRQFDVKTEQGGGGKPFAGNADVANILSDFGITLTGDKDPVADLIRESTSGWLEYGASMIPGAFGQATKGQENIGRLETIDNALVLALAGGKLGAGVSNADREFFKEMSGKISDPTVPANQRAAAWGQIKARLRGILSRSPPKAPAASPRRPSAPRSAVTPPTISDAQGYAALPSGALYVSPDRKTRRKP